MSANVTVTAIDKSIELYSSYIVGIVYIIFPLLLLVVYVVFNMVLHKNDEFRKLPAFRLMFYIGIFDCIQLICHIVSGILTLWPSISTRFPLLNRMAGATVDSAWMCLFPLSLITSLYRLMIIRKIADSNSKFPLLVKGAILLSFTYAFAFWICLLTFAEMLYDPTRWSWSYTDQKGSKIMSIIEVAVSVPIITFTFIVYMAIALTVYRTRHGATTVCRTELQLIIQAAISFAVLASVITFWHYYEYLFPNSLWTLFAINLLWMMSCGLSPLLYLACSRKIRQSFLQFIHAAPPERSTIAVSMIAVKSTQRTHQ